MAIEEVYSLRLNEIKTWKVVGSTAKTLKIRCDDGGKYLSGWVRTIRVSQLGCEFHETREGAIKRAIREQDEREVYHKSQVQHARSARGVYESMLRGLDASQEAAESPAQVIQNRS